MHDTRLVMRVVSLGRAARSKAGIKVRQPLAGATAFVHNAAQAEGLRRLEGQVLDELNVKQLTVIDTSDAFKGKTAVEHPKDLLALLPEGAALAEDDAGYAVGLDTKITPELADEGLARELVHRIQNARKAAGFEISDRIAVFYGDSERLRSVLPRTASMSARRRSRMRSRRETRRKARTWRSSHWTARRLRSRCAGSRRGGPGSSLLFRLVGLQAGRRFAGGDKQTAEGLPGALFERVALGPP